LYGYPLHTEVISRPNGSVPFSTIFLWTYIKFVDWIWFVQQIMKMSSAAQMEICHFIFCAISCFCVRKMSPSVVQIDICRLFRPSTDISHRKCCQQISFLWRGILSPSAQLIDPGQVTQSAHCSQSMVSSSFFITDIFFFPLAAVYFLYDLSPFTVTIKEEWRIFLHLVTRLCAVLDRFTSSLQDFIWCFFDLSSWWYQS
jgi:hypothetical protein